MVKKYRYTYADDGHPHRMIFETRYYAQKYVDAYWPNKRKDEYIIQKDPFGKEGYVIIFLEFAY